MQQNSAWPLFDRALEQMDMKKFDNRAGTEDTAENGSILDDSVMVPQWFDDHQCIFWGRTDDVRVAGEEPDGVEHLVVWRLQPKSAVEGANNYFALDRISPSFTRESRQALISA